MPSSGFSVVISATDKTAAGLGSVNRRLAALSAPAQRMQAEFKKFGQISGLSQISNGFSDIARTSVDALRGVARVVEPLAAITSAASVAGMYRMVTAWGRFGTTLGNTSTRLNVGVSDLYALQGAAGAAGSSADALTAGLDNLGTSMTDAAGGLNPAVANYFRNANIAFMDTNRHALNVMEVLPKLADRIASIKDPFLQAREATRFFGGAAEDLLPLLRKGGAGIAEYVAKSKAYGDMTKQQVKDANALREAQYWLGRSVDGTTNQVSAAIGPAITPLINQLSDYIKDHRPEINAFANEKATEFERWVDGGGLKRLEGDFKDVGARADAVAQYLGGWKAVTEDIIGLMTARFAIAFLAPFAQVGLGVVKLINSFRLLRATALSAEAAEATAAAPIAAPVAFVAAGAAVVGGFAYNALTETADDRAIDEQHHFRAGMPGRNVYPSVAAPNTAQQTATEKALYAEAIRLGDTPAQSAAWLSQAKRESSYNPAAVNAGHYGLFQWDPERQVNFLKYAGHSIVGSSPKEQIDFAHHEVATAYPKARDALAENRTYAPGAALGLQRYFEMTDNPEIEARKSVDFARDIETRIPTISIPPVAIPPSHAAPHADGRAGANGKVDVTIRTSDKAKVVATSSGDVNTPKIESSRYNPAEGYY